MMDCKREEKKTMKRDMNKLLEEYRKLADQGKGVMYSQDITQIYNMSDGNKFDCIVNAFSVGVAVGYRIRKREERNRKK